MSLLLAPLIQGAKLGGDVVALGGGSTGDQECQLVKVAAEDRQNSRFVTKRIRKSEKNH